MKTVGQLQPLIGKLKLNKIMKITFLLPHLKISGGVRLSLTYAHLLAEKGHQVTVVIKNKIFWRRFLANLINRKPLWFKNNQAKFLRIEDFQIQNIPDADIIIACYWQIVAFMSTLPSQKGIQYNFIQHDERLYHGQRDEVTRAYQKINKKIVLSNWLKEIIKNDFNQDSEVLITPVDFNLFHPVPDARIDSKVIKILLLHHSYKWKGTASGLEIVKKIKKTYPEVKLVFYGVRSEKIDLKDVDEYYFNLPQEKLAWLYSSCDIFLCPSEWEGLGMPGMEAMASGSCLVTNDTGGSRDYAFDGQTAFVAKHNDWEDLYQKLLLAVENKELREKIAKQGYEFITQKIDNWEQSAAKMEKMFESAL